MTKKERTWGELKYSFNYFFTKQLVITILKRKKGYTLLGPFSITVIIPKQYKYVYK